MINEDFFPYIFPETLYAIPSKGSVNIPVNETKSAVESPIIKTEPLENKTVAEPVATVHSPIKVIHAGNSSVLAVVIWSPKLDFSATDKELLHKILQACKLNPADIGIYHADNSTGLLFTDELPASKAIVFCSKDTIQSAKKAQINLYSQHALSGKTLLLSDALSELAQNNTLKGNLWKSLQSMLGL